MSHTGKPPPNVTIAPGSSEQTQTRRSELFGSSGPYRPIEVPARVRTTHACDRCRELRAKCSGGIRCAKCTKDDATCLYSDRKRERNKKNLARSTQQIDDLQNDRTILLNTLKSLVDGPGFDKDQYPAVLDVLERMSDSQSETRHSSRHISIQDPGRASSRGQMTDDSPMDIGETVGLPSAGESLVRSDVGSPDQLRELASAVDLDQGNGMPGYVGKMSDVSWIQKIRSHLAGGHSLGDLELKASDVDIQSLDTASLSYFTDDVNLLGVDEDYIDPHVIPNWNVAQVLTEAYFHSIQGSFRFVERTEFLQNLRGVYDTVAGRVSPGWPQRRTLALANVMWAIGARWIELAGLNDRHVPDHGKGLVVEDQLVYYARARSLGLDHRIQLEHPSLELVQGMAVLGFYLLSNGSVHRAWNMVAQTVRHATALGLHLKALPGVFTAEVLRRRVRVWWSLFRLEIMLSEITGRPKCINELDITTPTNSLFSDDEEDEADTPATSELPDAEYSSIETWNEFLGDTARVAQQFNGGIIPWSNMLHVGRDMSGSHFGATLELSGLSNKVGSSLYLSPADLTWADVQTTVRALESDLARWEASLHPDLRIANIGKTTLDPRINLDLELSLCSLRMILYRPFLCEIRIEDESAESTKYNQASARAGVNAAIHMTELLPDDPVAEQVLLVYPWWSLLHLVSQAAAVLTLELCLNAQHVQDETAGVMMALRKAMNYVWVLAPKSKSAYRAWHIYRPLVAKVAQKYRRSVLTDIPQNAARPESWNQQDETMLRSVIPRAGL